MTSDPPKAPIISPASQLSEESVPKQNITVEGPAVQFSSGSSESILGGLVDTRHRIYQSIPESSTQSSKISSEENSSSESISFADHDQDLRENPQDENIPFSNSLKDEQLQTSPVLIEESESEQPKLIKLNIGYQSDVNTTDSFDSIKDFISEMSRRSQVSLNNADDYETFKGKCYISFFGRGINLLTNDLDESTSPVTLLPHNISETHLIRTPIKPDIHSSAEESQSDEKNIFFFESPLTQKSTANKKNELEPIKISFGNDQLEDSLSSESEIYHNVIFEPVKQPQSLYTIHGNELKTSTHTEFNRDTSEDSDDDLYQPGLLTIITKMNLLNLVLTINLAISNVTPKPPKVSSDIDDDKTPTYNPSSSNGMFHIF